MPGKVKTLRSQGGEEGRHQNKCQGATALCEEGSSTPNTGSAQPTPELSSSHRPSTQGSVSASAGSSQGHAGTASPAPRSRQAPQQTVWGFLFVCFI